MALRVGHFPLTWAPIYTETRKLKNESRPAKKVKLIDKLFLETRGWHSTHRDGSRSWIRRSDINVRARNMCRLYYERSFGNPVPKYRQLNADAGNFDRWRFGLEPGEPCVLPQPQRDLLVSLNRTLGHRVPDPGFIVAVEASVVKRVIDKTSSAEVGRTRWTVEVEWQDAWAERMQ